MSDGQKHPAPPVSHGVERLIERLRDEGVAEGRAGARKIIEEAEARAHWLLQQAEEEAELIRRSALEAAERERRACDQACRLRPAMPC